MITTIIKKALPFILIGLSIALGISIIFGGNATYLNKLKVNDQITIYQLDMQSYFSNIRLSFDSIKSIPQKFVNFGAIQDNLSNNNAQGLDVLKLIANTFILFLNLLLIPFNFVGWIVNLLTSLIGIKDTESTHWVFFIFDIFRNMNVGYLT